MKTIAQQLNVTDFPFEIKDGNGRVIYYEEADGYWIKSEYDSEGNEIYYENYDGCWARKEYDSKGNEIYYEHSSGEIIDNRPKEGETTITNDELEEIITLNGVKYKRIDE